MSQDKNQPDDLPPEEKTGAGFMPDIVKRALLTGVGALFMTEEGIRNMVGEMKLPKDALAFLVAQADKSRSEVTRVVSQEVRRFLESETLRREIWKVLTSVTLEVNASLRLKQGGEPGFKARVRRRPASDDATEPARADQPDEPDEDEDP